MFADAKLHEENFKVFVRVRPIDQYERDQWRELSLVEKLEEFELLHCSNKIKRLKSPTHWHRFAENNEKNNDALQKVGLNEPEQRMFRKLLKTYSAEEIAGESEEDAIAFKLHAQENQLVTVNSITGEEEAYSYDEILWHDIKQGPAFNRMGYQTVEGVLNGINGTIFAYGQVGTGKTYSLLGPEPLAKAKPNEFGILPMAVQHIFRFLNLNKHNDNNSEITVSFLEIYLGNLKDLVEPFLPHRKEKKLHILNMKEEDYWLYMAEREGRAAHHKMKAAIKNHKTKEKASSEMTVIQNLSEHPVNSIKQFFNLAVQAIGNRTTNATLLNASSSRGHMICQVKVKVSRSSGIETMAKLNIVDLAGVDNISKTKPEGRALTEAKSVNSSLMAFREVIGALAKGKHRIPFRGSKIAMILKDSLGGNTRTSLLITLSPHKLHYHDSITNLKFGKKAKLVENKVKVNVKLNEQELIQMMQQKDAEIYNLKNQLKIANKKLEGQARKMMNRAPDSQYKLAEIPDSCYGPEQRVSEEALDMEGENNELAAARARSSNLVVDEFKERDKSDWRERDTDRSVVILEFGEKSELSATLQIPTPQYRSVEETVQELENSCFESELEEDLESKMHEISTDEVKEVKLNRHEVKPNQSWSDIESSKFKDRISGLEKRLRSTLEELNREKEAKLKLEKKFEQLRQYATEGKKKKKRRKKRKKSKAPSGTRRRAQTTVAEPSWKSTGLYDEKDSTDEMSVSNVLKLPARVKLGRTRIKSLGSASDHELTFSDDRQSVLKLTALESQHFESLCDLSGDLKEETLKVWLMMMMSIQEGGGEGDHNLISLADFFNFHIELPWSTQSTMSITQMFGILDNTNMGGISEWELSTFFQQVRRIDALKWGFSADHLDMGMTLENLTEVIELSHFLSKAAFENIDVDNDGLVSLDDVSAYFKKNGGRKWWNKGTDFSIMAIIEILTRVHLMKWQGDYWKINQDFVFEDPPGVAKREFDWFLVKYSISTCWLEIQDDLMETLPMEEDRFKIFEGLVPDWRDLFRENEIITADTHKGLSIAGAQELVSRLRSNDDFDKPAVSERDIAVIYLRGLSQRQMEMVVRSCPVKIWQSLVDENHQESCTDRVEEFRKLEEMVASELNHQSNPEEDEYMEMGFI